MRRRFIFACTSIPSALNPRNACDNVKQKRDPGIILSLRVSSPQQLEASQSITRSITPTPPFVFFSFAYICIAKCKHQRKKFRKHSLIPLLQQQKRRCFSQRFPFLCTKLNFLAGWQGKVSRLNNFPFNNNFCVLFVRTQQKNFEVSFT